MSVDPSKSSRFGSTKVKTGCLTCVKRRLKCGEEHLHGAKSCARCVKAGRPCIQRNQAENGHDNLRMVHYVSKPSWGPKALPFGESQELRYLEYFRLRTAPEIAGVHNPELWSYYVMQIAVAQPVIWHATLALGALHEHFESNVSGNLQPSNLEYPLAQYGKALNLLHSAMKDSSSCPKETPLLACAMFCAFESMGYHLHSALSHITSGLRVLMETKKDSRKKISASLDSSLKRLWPLFTRLDTQRLELGDASFSFDKPLMLKFRASHQVTEDINQARHAFDSVLHALLYQIKHLHNASSPNPDEPFDSTSNIFDLTRSIQEYLRWTKAFQDIATTAESEPDIKSALLMQTWRLLVNIMLRLNLKEGEMSFDRFRGEFQVMVLLIEEFLCWTAHYTGSGDSHLTGQSPSPLDEDLPEELRQRHTALAGEGAQQSGFMGVDVCQTPETKNVLAEAGVAQDCSQKLLHRSRTNRANNLNWTSESSGCWIKPTFTFSHGIIYPLYVLMNRCRDPTIRRRAWNLMDGCNRREGLWDSALAARLGQRIIQIEETQALQSFGRSSAKDIRITSASQIPNWSRIRMVRPTFLPNRRSIERYYFGWPGTFEEATGVEEVWIEESMEW